MTCQSGFVWRAVAGAAAIALSCALAIPAPAAAAGGWYAVLEGGIIGSMDRSNNDEVEFGNEPGGSLAAGVGHRFAVVGRWLANAELQLIGQTMPLHGRNDKREATADGRFLWLGGATANGWAEYQMAERWSVLAGGGAGPALIRAFGSAAATVLVHGGAAVRFQVSEALAVEAGGRAFWTAPAQVNGAQARYDSFGPVFRLSWFFR